MPLCEDCRSQSAGNEPPYKTLDVGEECDRCGSMKNRDSAIVWCSDGPKLILANGCVVRPLLANKEGEELVNWGEDQGSAVYGEECDEYDVSLAFVDDPDAKEVEAVQEALTSLGQYIGDEDE